MKLSEIIKDLQGSLKLFGDCEVININVRSDSLSTYFDTGPDKPTAIIENVELTEEEKAVRIKIPIVTSFKRSDVQKYISELGKE